MVHRDHTIRALLTVFEHRIAAWTSCCKADILILRVFHFFVFFLRLLAKNYSNAFKFVKVVYKVLLFFSAVRIVFFHLESNRIVELLFEISN